MMFMIWVV